MLNTATLEPIAIIGMGCRLPGVHHLAEFWPLLSQGRDATMTVPTDRWHAAALYDADRVAAGRINTQRGGFIADLHEFDAEFFGMYPREARRMDPQQRMTLEVAWEALEHAGIVPSTLAGQMVGVYMGVSHSDHGRKLHADVASMDGFEGSNYYHGFVAHRLSYLLDLHGPSLAVDTACSSSLAAIHLACQALRTGECELALTGGVNANLLPGETISASIANMLSDDGRCKAFDTSGDGFGRGEGCGIVVLKRLNDAIAAGDSIAAVIRGSAINHNGLSNGITSPSGRAQQAVVRRALAVAGIAANEISYLEAHGTGSVQGDQIELRALQQVLSEGRAPDTPCWIGTVKTNIGHLEAASGVAGLIKTVLAMQHQQLPPTLHLQQPQVGLTNNPNLFSAVTTLQPWHTNGPRRAGISAFGFGGANGHLILEEAPTVATATAIAVDRTSHLLVLHAKSEPALRKLAQRYAAWLASDHTPPTLGDLCFSAAVSREPFDYRLAIPCDDHSTLAGQLASFAVHGQAEGLHTGRISRQRPKIVWQFDSTGLGVEHLQALYRTSPPFKQAFVECLSAWQIPNTIPSAQTTASPFQIVAGQIALARLYQTWGWTPYALTGTGLGLWAAAAVSGHVTLPQLTDLMLSDAETWQGTTAAAGRWPIHLPNGQPWPATTTSPPSDNPLASCWRLGYHQGLPCLISTNAEQHPQTDDCWLALHHIVACLYVNGTRINWHSLETDYDRHRCSLPTYTFDRQFLPFDGQVLPQDAELSRQLASELRSKPDLFDAIVVPLNQGVATSPPLFLVHPIGGSVLCYRELVMNLGQDIPVYGLQSPFLNDESTTFPSLEAMADRYLACARHIQPTGPLHLAGWSMGGAIAFEMAQQLAKQGDTAQLTLIDTHLPSTGWVDRNTRSLLLTMALDMGIPYDTLDRNWLLQAELEPGLRYVMDKARQAGDTSLLPSETDLLSRLTLLRQHVAIFRRYQPQPFGGALTILRAATVIGESEAFDDDLGWRTLVASVQTGDVQGHHFSMLRAPNVQAVAQRISLSHGVNTLLAQFSRPHHPDLPATSPGLKSAADIEHWALQWLSQQLGVAPDTLDIDQPFTQFGINSISVVRFIRDMSQWLGTSLVVSTLWNFRTIRTLATYLANPTIATADDDSPATCDTVIEGVL
ncbi:beta-ketoacyl synthase N-terminal-like domain-containing protein [Chitinivorax sp. B]|uniref:type I polyketide synthase n=1 Tax=Chitinivorax sp. B TaxID=2502235 RepID=UPI0010F9A615|nr:beta-ketoacyl synthase N-terminal-like domain-containing protein [Chitinivorax sp. B]